MIREAIRRSSWLAIGAGAGRLLPLMILLLASRWMDSRQFASASAGYAWAGVAMSLTSAGLATVMTQRLGSTSDAREQTRLILHHLNLSITGSTLLALALLLFGKRWCTVIFGNALDPAVVVPSALAAVLWSQVAVCVAALNGCHQARAASLALATCGLLQGAGMGFAIHVVGANAKASTWGLFVGNAVACCVAVFLVRRALPGLRWRSTDGVLKPATPAVALRRDPVLWSTVAAASVVPASFFASSMISHGPDGVRQLAQYFALEQVHQLLVYLPAIVGQALLPLISQRFARSTGRGQRAHLLRRMALVSTVTASCGLLAGIASSMDVRWLVHLLANPTLGVEDIWTIRWMVLNAAVALSLAITGGAYLGAGHIVAAGLLNLSWGAIFVGLTAVLSWHGNLGLQAARFVASVSLETMAVLILLTLAAKEARLIERQSAAQEECA